MGTVSLGHHHGLSEDYARVAHLIHGTLVLLLRALLRALSHYAGSKTTASREVTINSMTKHLPSMDSHIPVTLCMKGPHGSHEARMGTTRSQGFEQGQLAAGRKHFERHNAQP